MAFTDATQWPLIEKQILAQDFNFLILMTRVSRFARESTLPVTNHGCMCQNKTGISFLLNVTLCRMIQKDAFDEQDTKETLTGAAVTLAPTVATLPPDCSQEDDQHVTRAVEPSVEQPERFACQDRVAIAVAGRQHGRQPHRQRWQDGPIACARAHHTIRD